LVGDSERERRDVWGRRMRGEGVGLISAPQDDGRVRGNG